MNKDDECIYNRERRMDKIKKKKNKKKKKKKKKKKSEEKSCNGATDNERPFGPPSSPLASQHPTAGPMKKKTHTHTTQKQKNTQRTLTTTETRTVATFPKKM